MKRLTGLRCAAIVLLSGTLGSCGTTESASIELIVGGELDALTRVPTPTRLVLEAEALSTGAKRTLFDGPLGDASAAPLRSDEVLRVLLRGTDASGTVRVAGVSPYFEAGGLEGGTLRLFVQRTGELARLPDVLPDTTALPFAFEIGGRGLFVIPRGQATGKLYDFITWSVAGTSYTLPRAPRSITVNDRVLLLIDDAAASFVDLSDGSTREVSAPTGESFATVAGGDTLYATDGTAYVVGATRTDAPSDRILRVAPDGSATFVKLLASRSGAAAAWVEGRGVVVVGGSPTGPGVEVLADAASATVALAFPPDGSTDQAATALDTSHVFATFPPRVFDLACTTACAPTPFADFPKLARPRAVVVSATDALVVGDDDAGTKVFRVSRNSAAEVSVRAPRTGGVLAAAPSIGAYVLAGGTGTLEAFRP